MNCFSAFQFCLLCIFFRLLIVSWDHEPRTLRLPLSCLELPESFIQFDIIIKFLSIFMPRGILEIYVWTVPCLSQ
jgi:hypothetical protein